MKNFRNNFNSAPSCRALLALALATIPFLGSCGPVYHGLAGISKMMPEDKVIKCPYCLKKIEPTVKQCPFCKRDVTFDLGSAQ